MEYTIVFTKSGKQLLKINGKRSPASRRNMAALQKAGYRLAYGRGCIEVNGHPVEVELFDRCSTDAMLDLVERRIGPARTPVPICEAAADMVRARNIGDFMAAAKAAGCDLGGAK